MKFALNIILLSLSGQEKSIRLCSSLHDRIDIHIEMPKVDYEKLSGIK